MKRPRQWLLLLAAGLWLSACSTQPPTGITPVTGFDVQRYGGKWYELARLDNRFEKGLTDVSATYTPQPNGSVKVLNRGYSPQEARWEEAEGKALFNGDPKIASLKVSFFGPFYGGYHVIALDPQYQWAMVAGSDHSYLWILARQRYLPEDVTTRLRQQAHQLGFDTSKLILVSQSRPDNASPQAPVK